MIDKVEQLGRIQSKGELCCLQRNSRERTVLYKTLYEVVKALNNFGYCGQIGTLQASYP